MALSSNPGADHGALGSQASNDPGESAHLQPGVNAGVPSFAGFPDPAADGLLYLILAAGEHGAERLRGPHGANATAVKIWKALAEITSSDPMLTPRARARKAFMLSREQFEKHVTDAGTALRVRKRLLHFAAKHGNLRALVDLAATMIAEHDESARPVASQGEGAQNFDARIQGIHITLREAFLRDVEGREHMNLAAVELVAGVVDHDPLPDLLAAALRQIIAADHDLQAASTGDRSKDASVFDEDFEAALLILAWAAVYGRALAERPRTWSQHMLAGGDHADGGQSRTHRLRAESVLGPCFVRLGLLRHVDANRDKPSRANAGEDPGVLHNLQAAWIEVLSLQAAGVGRARGATPPVELQLQDRPPQMARSAGQQEPTIVIISQPIPGTQPGKGQGRGLKDLKDSEEAQALLDYVVLTRPLPATALPDLPQLQSIQDRLVAEFAWTPRTVENLLAPLMLSRRAGARILRLQPTLLVGHPGSGKSRLARRLAQELGLPMVSLMMGGSGDEKMLLGTARGWSSAQPSPIVSELAERKRATALVLLDEIDKTGERGYGGNRSLESILLGLLEPETARQWRDVFLRAPCDLSQLSWVATSNSLQAVSKPLQSRLDLQLVSEPGPEYFAQIVPFIVRDLEDDMLIPRGALPVPRAHEVQAWRDVTSVRALQRRVRQWLHEALGSAHAMRH
jgi:hypothetical protein